MLLLNNCGKSYIGSRMSPLDFTLQSQGHSRFLVVGDMYGMDVFASSLLQPYWCH